MAEITMDLLDVTEGIIVHGCNCQGVMGSGIAAAIRKKWPNVYSNYKSLEDEHGLYLGDIQICASGFLPNTEIYEKYNSWLTLELPPKLVVVNAMTQFHYGKSGKVYVDYDAVFACFAKIRMLARDTGMVVYYPKIGSGLGGGDWDIIKGQINAGLGIGITRALVELPKVSTKY